MKTMNTIKYMGMALIMAALASCSSDDDFGTNWQNDPTAVRVSATVGGVFTRSNPVAEEELTNFKKKRCYKHFHWRTENSVLQI